MMRMAAAAARHRGPDSPRLWLRSASPCRTLGPQLQGERPFSAHRVFTCNRRRIRDGFPRIASEIPDLHEPVEHGAQHIDSVFLAAGREAIRGERSPARRAAGGARGPTNRSAGAARNALYAL